MKRVYALYRVSTAKQVDVTKEGRHSHAEDRLP